MLQLHWRGLHRIRCMPRGDCNCLLIVVTLKLYVVLNFVWYAILYLYLMRMPSLFGCLLFRKGMNIIAWFCITIFLFWEMLCSIFFALSQILYCSHCTILILTEIFNLLCIFLIHDSILCQSLILSPVQDEVIFFFWKYQDKVIAIIFVADNIC